MFINLLNRVNDPWVKNKKMQLNKFLMPLYSFENMSKDVKNKGFTNL